MNNILELSNNIDNEIDINKKMKMINELNILIEKQKDHYNQLTLQITQEISQNIKIESKYKNKTIEELEELFNSKNNIEDKISIYYAINIYYNNIINKLFN